MILHLLFACAAHPVIGGELPADTAEAADADSDSDADSDTDADPETDWTAYEGSRTFSASVMGYACEDTTADSGVEITSGDAYDQLVDLCPACTHYYENTPTEDAVCDGYLALSTTYRGVLVAESGVLAYFYSEGDSGLYEAANDASVSFDGENMAFDYELDFYGVPVNVVGEMNFAMTE